MNKYILLSVFVLFLSGCSSNTYQETSSCKIGVDNQGRCEDINNSYKRSLGKNNENNLSSKLELAKLQQIIKQDNNEIPLLQNPVVRKILIMPYVSKDSKTWFEQRNIFYIEKDPQWSFDYSTKNNNIENNILNNQ